MKKLLLILLILLFPSFCFGQAILGNGGGYSKYSSGHDCDSYASINVAVAALGGSNTTLVISSPKELTGNLTIPNRLNVLILKGGSIAASNYTLTINGQFQAGLYQVFIGFVPGNIVFGPGSVAEIHAVWFGAYDNNVNATQTTSAINQAASAGRTHTIPIRLVGGFYATNDSLNFTCAGSQGWRLKGDGETVTIITGTLSHAYPLVDCSGSEKMIVEDIGIIGGNGGSQTCGLLIARTPNSSVGQGGCCYVINRVQITGTLAKVGMANASADQSTVDGSYIEGPVGYVISPTDVLGVGSEYVSLTPSATANTYNAINNCPAIIGTSRAAVLYDSGQSLVCNNSFFDTYPSCPSYFELIGTGYKSIKLYGCRGENSGNNDPVYILNMGTGISSQGGHLEGEFQTSNSGAIVKGSVSNYFINIQLASLQGNLVLGKVTYSILYNAQNLSSTINPTVSICNIILGGGSQRTEWETGTNLYLSGSGQQYGNFVNEKKS